MDTRGAVEHAHGFQQRTTVEYLPCEKTIVKRVRMGHQDDAVVQKNEAWVSFGRGCKLVAVFADGSTTKTDLEHDDVFNVETTEPQQKTQKTRPAT